MRNDVYLQEKSFKPRIQVHHFCCHNHTGHGIDEMRRVQIIIVF